jgi:hypothetical protein
MSEPFRPKLYQQQSLAALKSYLADVAATGDAPIQRRLTQRIFNTGESVLLQCPSGNILNRWNHL